MKQVPTNDIFNDLLDQLWKIEPYFKIYKTKEKENEESYRLHPDYFDVDRIVRGWSEIDLFNQLWSILELIYKEKSFSLLISDIAFLLASIDSEIFLKKSQDFLIPIDTLNITENRYFQHLSIARNHLAIFLLKKFPPSQQDADKLWLDSNTFLPDEVTFLYTENKAYIDQIDKLWLNTRHYFEYDREYAIYGGIAKILTYGKFIGEAYRLKDLEDNSKIIFPKYKQDYIKKYWNIDTNIASVINVEKKLSWISQQVKSYPILSAMVFIWIPQYCILAIFWSYEVDNWNIAIAYILLSILLLWVFTAYAAHLRWRSKFWGIGLVLGLFIISVLSIKS